MNILDIENANVEKKLSMLYAERERMLAKIDSSLGGKNILKHVDFSRLKTKFSEDFLISNNVIERHVNSINNLIKMLEALRNYDSLIIFYETGIEVDVVLEDSDYVEIPEFSAGEIEKN